MMDGKLPFPRYVELKRRSTAGADKIQGLGELVESRLTMASLLFLLALLVRVYYALTHPDFDNIFAVRGEPYSDGFTWTSAAVKLARGNGLDQFIGRDFRSYLHGSMFGLAIQRTSLLLSRS